MTMNENQDAVVERESIYRKYIEGAIRIIQERHLGFETGWVHLSSLSYIIPSHLVQVAPLEENIQYCLLLLRSKTHEHINQAKEHLIRCLKCQNKDGSFPFHALDLKEPSDWAPSFRLLLVLEQILDDFSTVLGSDVVAVLSDAYIRLQTWCSQLSHVKHDSSLTAPNSLVFIYLLSLLKKEADSKDILDRIQKSLSAILDQLEMLDFKMWGMIVALLLYHKELLWKENSIKNTAQRILKRFFKFWSSSLEYVGPSFSSQQLADERAISLFHIAMSLLTEKKLKLKPEKWPYEAYLSLGVLYPLSKVSSSDVLGMQSEYHEQDENENWGVVPFSKDIFLGYCVESSSSHKCMKGFSPCVVTSDSWNLNFRSTQYNLDKVNIEEKEKTIVRLQFSKIATQNAEERINEGSERKTEGQSVCEFYVERKEGIGFKPFFGAKASRFSLDNAIFVGDLSDNNHLNGVTLKLEIPGYSENIEARFHAHIRASNRPGQLMHVPPHFPKRVMQVFVEAYDWLLSVEAPPLGDCEVPSFTVAISLA